MHAGVRLSAKRKREQVRQRYPGSENEYPEYYRAQHYAFLRTELSLLRLNVTIPRHAGVDNRRFLAGLRSRPIDCAIG